jgi:hypothetical protein
LVQLAQELLGQVPHLAHSNLARPQQQQQQEVQAAMRQYSATQFATVTTCWLPLLWATKHLL